MERRELGLGVLAIFLAAAVVTGLHPGLWWVSRSHALGLVALALICIVVAAMLLAGASPRTPRRALTGVIAGIVGVGILAWPSSGGGFLLGLRIGTALALLALIPKAWGRRRRGVDHGQRF